MEEVTQYYCPECEDPKIVHYPDGSVFAFGIHSDTDSQLRGTNTSYSCRLCGYVMHFETLDILRGRVFIKEGAEPQL